MSWIVSDKATETNEHEKTNRPLTSYRDLDIWQKSMDLTQLIYEMTRQLPDDERFGLISQTRRAAVSIPSNIAEGYGRMHTLEYIRFLSIANGSLKELETQVILIKRLAFIPGEQLTIIWKLTQDIGKMLFKLMQSLKNQHA